MRRLMMIAFMLSAVSMVFGQSIKEKSTTFGLKGGLISSGTVTVDGVGEFDTDSNFSLGGFVDYRVAEKLTGGLAVDMHNVSAMDESEFLFNFALALKAMISGDNSNLIFRPGASIGYGTLGSVAGTESSQYFTVGGGAELIYVTGGGMSWLGEIAIYAAPSGGNSDFDITFGPMFLIRGGLVF